MLFLESFINKHAFFVLISAIIVLMIVNWSIESFKWRFLILKIEKLKYLKAIKAVFAGITVSIFTPNKTGEFAGRMLAIDKASRWDSIMITFIGSISQLLVTIVFGLLALNFAAFFFDIEHAVINIYLKLGFLLFSLILLFLSIMLYLNISIITFLGKKIRAAYLQKFSKYLLIFRRYTKKELLKVFFFSVLRYCVFSFQFLIILRFFNIQIPVLHLACLSSVWFFVITVVPTIALTEIGVRGAASIFLFDFYLEHFSTIPFTDDIHLKIVSATFILWIINIILPSLLGALFILQFNIFKRKSNGN